MHRWCFRREPQEGVPVLVQPVAVCGLPLPHSGYLHPLPQEWPRCVGVWMCACDVHIWNFGRSFHVINYTGVLRMYGFVYSGQYHTTKGCKHLRHQEKFVVNLDFHYCIVCSCHRLNGRDICSSGVDDATLLDYPAPGSLASHGGLHSRSCVYLLSAGMLQMMQIFS